MSTGPWQLQLVQATEILPVKWRRPRRPRTPAGPTRARTGDQLFDAFDLLSRRGVGPTAWATPLRDDPIAFLLDTMSDSVALWGPTGRLLNQNRAALELGMANPDESPLQLFSASGEPYERRCLSPQPGNRSYMLEIIRHLRPAPASPRR
jgi:hypothetical protein